MTKQDKMKEETLSDKKKRIQVSCPDNKEGCLVYHFKEYFFKEDVKDFIKKLKEIGKTKVSNEGDYCYILSEEEIDKLAGNELI